MGPREVRERAGITIIQAAVWAGKAEGTVRLYEASRDAVSAKSRAALDAFYTRLAAGAVGPMGISALATPARIRAT